MPVRVEALERNECEEATKKTVKIRIYSRKRNQLSNKFGSSVNISETKRVRDIFNRLCFADELNRILDLLGVDLDG